MDNVNNKLLEIKTRFFKNVFNEEYISDSFDFLHSLNFFDNYEENRISLFDKEFANKQNELIFHQIKQIYDLKKRKLEKNEVKPKYTINKLKNLYLEKLKGNLVQSEEVKEEKTNKYASMMEALFFQRQEEDRKEKELKDKCNEVFNFYERDEVIEFLTLIKQNEKVKNKIFSDQPQPTTQLIQFEQEILDYFISETTNKIGYKKLNNKEFEILFKSEGKNGGTIMFEKEVDININHFLALIYESDYYNKWMPFCTESACLFQPGKSKKLIYMVNSLPIISNRDFLVYGFGLNKLKSDRVIYLLCRSVLEDNEVFKEHFLKKAGKKYVRGEIKIFGFEMKIINANKVNVKALINTDPKIDFIPQWLIDTIAQKFATDLFTKLIDISKNFEGSEFQNKNPSKMDRIFYDYIEAEIAKLGL